MNYHTYELAHRVLTPLRWGVHGLKAQLTSPLNPFRAMLLPRMVAASCDVFESVTRRYGKPAFGLDHTRVSGMPVDVHEEIVLKKTFCNLVRFKRDESHIGRRSDPKMLLVAPMSGHYATLLRGTVRAMLPDHDVYITDWMDARVVPASDGPFGLDDFIDYIMDFVRFLGKDVHIVAVCQPSVPVLAAVALMGAQGDPLAPASMTLMGGPIDTRRNPTAVNKLAGEKPIEWFQRNVISRVPFPHAGYTRPVYPGFIQLTGFMTMNLDRHMSAHRKLFDNLVQGDCDSVQQHRDFYEEYLSVMDLPAEFYLDTVAKVFQEHALPDGKLMHRGQSVDCRAITKTALMTVEGERDDICGLGQTEAAHDLCSNIPMDAKYHYVQMGVGHYGVFNGTRWRTEIQPRIREFIKTIQFKRMIGSSSMRGSLPYKGLRDEREEIVEYQQQVGGAA